LGYFGVLKDRNRNYFTKGLAMFKTIFSLCIVVGLLFLAGCSSPFYKDSKTGAYVPKERYLVATGKQISYTVPYSGQLYAVLNRDQRIEPVGTWPILFNVNVQSRQTFASRNVAQFEKIEINFLDAEQAKQWGLVASLTSDGQVVELYFIPKTQVKNK
jgi:hypothetical protein